MPKRKVSVARAVRLTSLYFFFFFSCFFFPALLHSRKIALRDFCGDVAAGELMPKFEEAHFFGRNLLDLFYFFIHARYLIYFHTHSSFFVTQ